MTKIVLNSLMRQAIVKRTLLIAMAMLISPFLGQTAHANSLDFTCATMGPTACTGSVALAGGVYSSSNIGLFMDSGPAAFLNQAFILAFNTSTNTMSLTDGGTVLSGTITNFGVNPAVNTADFFFNANWTSLPASFQTFLSSTTGVDQGFLIYTTANGAAVSSDIFITPTTLTPEPGSAIMLGTALLGLCGMIRRKGSNI